MTVDSGGTLSVNSGVTFTVADGTGTDLTVNGAVSNAGTITNSGQATVNGTWTRAGGSLNTNPPTYSTNSTLVYDANTSGFAARGLEWSATSGAGYPYNVRVKSNSSIDLGNGGAGTARQMAGSLTIDSGGELSMNATPMTAALSVLGSVTVSNGGYLTLSSQSGGDLNVGGNFGIGTSTGGAFANNGRRVTFNGSGSTQTISSSGSLAFKDFATASGASVMSSSSFSVTGNWTNDGSYTGNSETVTFNGSSAQTIGGSKATDFKNLTINNSAGVSLGSNQNVGGVLSLTSGDLNTGSNTLTQSGTSSGTTDVVGSVRRADLGSTARSFGNPNVQVSFQSGTVPTEVTVKLVKSVPAGTNFGFPTAIQRYYTVTQAGGSGFGATLRLHYLDSELNGNLEPNLNLWRHNGSSSWNRVVKTGTSVEGLEQNEYVEASGVTQFSSWTLSSVVTTKARLVEFKATQYDDGVALAWKTGYEVDNLGFNVYREVAGRRTLLNRAPVAGSALVAGQGVALTAGNSYSWADARATGARYWLEEIDLSGKSTFHGPFVPTRSTARGAKGARSPLITELSAAPQTAQDGQRQLTASDAALSKMTRAEGRGAATASADKQRWLASRPGVKIGVRAAGWYHVTREQLVAAGLVASADPSRLQMYAGGAEVPIRVGTDGSVEFYGEGLDVQSTDTRVYWLVEGDAAGLRTNAGRSASAPPVRPDGVDDAAGPGGAENGDGVGQSGGMPAVTVIPFEQPPAPPDSFSYTLERRDRSVYFSGLQNGEAENFFGKVVNGTQSSQTLTVRNLLPNDAPTTTLEVALQGLTAGEHHVTVLFNGSQLGTIDFAGQTGKTATFPVESYLVREGDNQVQMVSGGSSDVSLTGHLRLTYLHTMRADDDRLRFSAPSGPVRVGGFSTPYVRVVDVTDPSAPFELQVEGDAIPDPQGGWSVQVNAAAGPARELYAFADTQLMRPAALTANAPSSLSTDAGQRADMVIITHGGFAQQVAPLAARRSAEGMEVKVVDVEDLYDEFSYGAHAPQAVRDFLAWTKANWEKAPAYVLLVGDGSYDPRDYFGRGRYDLVPSKLVDAGAMETASDDWFADFDGDGVADMAVGRLPVRTQAEAATVVGKILGRTFDSSQTSALMVADRNGSDGYSFEAATDGVQSLLPPGASVSRVNRGAQDAATVRGQIVAGVNSGPLVVNWMGHGSIDVWTGDGLLRGSDAPSLTNGSRLPLFVMMTCLNGYYEGTGGDSLAESVLKAEQGGAYAVWASSGMTEPNAQAEVNRELYRIIFSGQPVRLGDAVRSAKAATADGDVRRTWVLFGDPASRLR